jgi:hypothetical protein
MVVDAAWYPFFFRLSAPWWISKTLLIHYLRQASNSENGQHGINYGRRNTKKNVNQIAQSVTHNFNRKHHPSSKSYR